MGFQIGGTTVLDSNGIQNNANSFKTLDGNSILGSGNITDNGPAEALEYGKVGVYTWANYIPPATSSNVTTVDTSLSLAAGGTVAASNIGIAAEDYRFDYRVAIWEPGRADLYNVAGTGGGVVPNPHSSAQYTGYSGTWRNMLTVRKALYGSIFVRIS